MSELLAYVGTYTRHGAAGIYRLRLDAHDGQALALELVAATDDPSFLALHPTLPRLYAVNETLEFGGQATGSVSAFAINPVDGALTLMNRLPSRGRWPAHVSVNAGGSHLLVANYADPTVAMFALARDGSLAAEPFVVRHAGRTGPNPERQEAPHPHAVTLDRRNAHAFVADLGLDQLVAYRFDPALNRLAPSPELSITAKPGAGPRRVIFNASASQAYLICELTSEIVVFDYDEAAGRLTARQTIPTLPPDFAGANTAAEIVIHPTGRLLFATNRGHDSVAVYDVGADGRLALRTHLPSGGRTPRHLAIDRTGRTLLVSNQDTDNLAVYHFDAVARSFRLAGSIPVPAPVFAVFAESHR